MISLKLKVKSSKLWLALSERSESKGFTMIELLIVIAVLGVLAVAVLSAINPIEQINRGRDTGSRSDSEQLLSAIDRYYTTQEMYPWQTAPDANEEQQWVTVDNTWFDDAGTPVEVLTKLSSGGTAELKSGFRTRLNALAEVNKLKVHHSIPEVGQQNSVYVCFQARSGSFKTEANNRCIDVECTGLPEDISAVACANICGDIRAPHICLP